MVRFPDWVKEVRFWMAAAVLGVVMIEMPRPLANSCEVKTQSCGEPKVELMHCGLNVHGDAGSSGSSARSL